jgi:hypothetical protein
MFAAVLIELALPVPVEFTVGAKMGTGVTHAFVSLVYAKLELLGLVGLPSCNRCS